jgi:hypothetical protein
MSFLTPRRSYLRFAKMRVFNKSFGSADFFPTVRSRTGLEGFSLRVFVDTEIQKCWVEGLFRGVQAEH